jgi:hypothetical protein
MRIRIQAFMTKIDKKLLLKKNLNFFLIKNYNLPIHRPTQRTPKLQEKPSALKREHPVLKNMKILDFFLFLWVIFALLDSNCGSGSSNSN